jgi:hypothetical protein
MALPIEIPAELKQRAYDCYIHHRSVSLLAISELLGVSRVSFFRLRKAWGWPPRREAMRQALAAGASAGASFAPAIPCAPAPDPSTLRDAALSLAKAARTRIDALLSEQHSGGPIDHDKTARTLASYAKTLTAAQSLLEQEGLRLDDTERHEGSPRTIHELRDELAHHLERIVAEEEAAGRDGLLV